jgi:hypothetical protein
MMQLLGPHETRRPSELAHGEPLPKECSGAALTRNESQPAGSRPLLEDLEAVQALLGRALPHLWRYALSRSNGSTERWRRHKLRELIHWVLTKEGYRVEARVNSPYSRDGEQIRGRLELLIANSTRQPMLALETDWSTERESLLKLDVWHRRGIPGLWILGHPCQRKDLAEFRKLANRTLGHDTSAWLFIFHLSYGWQEAPRSARRL